MPTEDDVRKQLDLELFDEKEAASLAELAGEYDRDQNLVPMVLGGSGPVRVINLAEMEVPDEWKKRYSLLPDKKTEAEISATLDSPPARQNWLDTEPDLELVQQVPSGEREQWRDLEAAAIDRRLGDVEKNWMEMAQLCGVSDEPGVVRILRDEKLLHAVNRWKPVIGGKHYKRLSTKWAARLNAREKELELKQTRQVVERARLEKAGEGKIHRAARQDSRKARIAEIKRDYPERANDIPFVCAKLDASNSPLPHESQWENKSEQRTWVGNYDYKDTRSAVQRYVSEVRAAAPKRKRHS